MGLVPAHVLLVIDSGDLSIGSNFHRAIYILLSLPGNTEADNKTDEEDSKDNGCNDPIGIKVIIVIVARIGQRAGGGMVRA